MKNSFTHLNESLVNNYAQFVRFYLIPKFLPGRKPYLVPLIDKTLYYMFYQPSLEAC